PSRRLRQGAVLSRRRSKAPRARRRGPARHRPPRHPCPARSRPLQKEDRRHRDPPARPRRRSHGADLMNLPSRSLDELQGAPALAPPPALSASIDAFLRALDLAHPPLGSTNPRSERESAAMLLHMYLDASQEILRLYDHLTFDGWTFSNDQPDDQPDDDIPF